MSELSSHVHVRDQFSLASEETPSHEGIENLFKNDIILCSKENCDDCCCTKECVLLNWIKEETEKDKNLKLPFHGEQLIELTKYNWDKTLIQISSVLKSIDRFPS